MKRLLYFTIIIAILLGAPATGFTNNIFSDVTSEHPAFEAIKNVKNLGIINGYTDGSFLPDNNITRAEMACILCRMNEDFPTDNLKNPFNDVSKNHWALGYISKAYEKAIILGDGNGNFNPEANIKYEEAIKMTVMATGYGKNITPYYSDWAKAYIDIADTTKISEGIKASRGEFVTRAQVAVMINNALGLKEKDGLVLYAKTIYNNNLQIPTNVSFAIDTSLLLNGDTQYFTQLAKASAVLSMTAYSNIYIDDTKKGNSDTLLKALGFTNIKKVNLKDTFSDNHITSFYMGEKQIQTDGKKGRIVSVVVRGTDGSLKEWSSNFDIGSGEGEDTYTLQNHKGYDITAQRVLAEISAYMSQNASFDTEDIVWLTGHSRGGSVANICASYLTDNGTKCFAYTFGASKTTVGKNASQYKHIFNIVNSDDLVTYIPMSEWGFTLYGKTAQMSVSQNLLEKWSETTGLKKYNYKTSIEEVASKMARCAQSRKDCYTYTDGQKIQIELKSKEECNEYQNALTSSFAEGSLQYCKFETKKLPAGSKYPYVLEVYMQPSFLMQNIASVMAGKTSMLSFLTLPLTDNLGQTHSAVISAYMGGLTHPHTPETYYVLSCNITADDFK